MKTRFIRELACQNCKTNLGEVRGAVTYESEELPKYHSWERNLDGKMMPSFPLLNENASVFLNEQKVEIKDLPFSCLPMVMCNKCQTLHYMYGTVCARFILRRKRGTVKKGR